MSVLKILHKLEVGKKNWSFQNWRASWKFRWEGIIERCDRVLNKDFAQFYYSGKNGKARSLGAVFFIPDTVDRPLSQITSKKWTMSNTALISEWIRSLTQIPQRVQIFLSRLSA